MPCTATPATVMDAMWLSTRLRPADQQELMAASGLSPVDALTQAVGDAGRETLVGKDETGKPFLLYGLEPVGRETAKVWAVGTDDLPLHGRQFMRDSRKWLDECNARYPLLYNFVDARNTGHIRWLKAVGCVFIKRIEHYGHQGLPFYLFVRIKP